MAEKMILGSDKLRDVLTQFPEQCKAGWELGEKIKVEGHIDNIFLLGMGGSALGGELLKAFLIDSKIPMFIVKDYKIPRYLTEKSLVFAVSYSGNTEETISAYREAVKKTKKMVVIAAGAKLEELAKANKNTFIKLPGGLQPRFSYGLQFFALLRVLANSDLVSTKASDVEHAVQALKPDKFSEIGKGIAEKLADKIPIIYTSEKLRAVGYKWKITLNECAKIHAFINVYPEWNHNELVGYTKLNGNYHVIIIKDDEEHPRIKKRMDITKELMKEKGVGVSELSVKGDNMLTKIISAVGIGDWTAYHLAQKYGIDPWSVDIVEKLKEEMKNE